VIRMRHAPRSTVSSGLTGLKASTWIPRRAGAGKSSGSTEAAPAVVDEIHLDAFRLLLQQQVGKTSTVSSSSMMKVSRLIWSLAFSIALNIAA